MRVQPLPKDVRELLDRLKMTQGQCNKRGREVLADAAEAIFELSARLADLQRRIVAYADAKAVAEGLTTVEEQDQPVGEETR